MELFEVKGTRFVKQQEKLSEDTLSLLEYSDCLRVLQRNDFLNLALTTPSNYHIGPVENRWHKDYSSGRSFNYTFFEEGMPITICSKGFDIYDRNSKYRRFHIDDGCITGTAFSRELETEFLKSFMVQDKAIENLGRTTYAPIPLNFVEIDTVLNEENMQIPYRDYFEDVLKRFPEYRRGLVFLFANHPIFNEYNFLDMIKLSDLNSKTLKYEPIANAFLEPFLRETQGSYLYSIKGFNTRLIDAKKLSKTKLEEIVSSQYPKMNTEEILVEFIRRLAETKGITYSANLSTKHPRNCILIDTTIGGCSVDNGHLTKGVDIEAISRDIVETELVSEYFSKRVLGIDPLKNFKEEYIKTVLENCETNNLKNMVFKALENTPPKDTFSLSETFYMANMFHPLRFRNLAMRHKPLKKFAYI